MIKKSILLMLFKMVLSLYGSNEKGVQDEPKAGLHPLDHSSILMRGTNGYHWSYASFHYAFLFHLLVATFPSESAFLFFRRCIIGILVWMIINLTTTSFVYMCIGDIWEKQKTKGRISLRFCCSHTLVSIDSPLVYE